MTDERKQEIKAATVENPVHLSREEEIELRAENRARFQADVGAGLYTVPIAPGSIAERAVALRDRGMNSEAIAGELCLSIGSTRVLLTRILRRQRDLAKRNAIQMKDAKYSNAEIAEHLGLTESSVRTILGDQS